MTPLRNHTKGSVGMIVGEISVGVVVLFVGIFMLASIEPVFAGRLTQCSYTNTAPSAAAYLNASAPSGASTSANMTFATATNLQGTCTLVLNISNVSATAGSYIEVRNAATLALLNNHTIPTTYQQFTSSTTISHSSGNYLINVTAFGDDNATITTSGSYLRRCSSLVAQSGPAGQNYDQIVASIATAFAVFGLVLIVVGLATAIGSLRQMM
jgi:hypothetical protein